MTLFVVAHFSPPASSRFGEALEVPARLLERLSRSLGIRIRHTLVPTLKPCLGQSCTEAFGSRRTPMCFGFWTRRSPFLRDCTFPRSPSGEKTGGYVTPPEAGAP